MRCVPDRAGPSVRRRSGSSYFATNSWQGAVSVCLPHAIVNVPLPPSSVLVSNDIVSVAALSLAPSLLNVNGASTSGLKSAPGNTFSFIALVESSSAGANLPYLSQCSAQVWEPAAIFAPPVTGSLIGSRLADADFPGRVP